MTLVRCFPELDPAKYVASKLHDATRDWPETNCYTDVWIELLHATGHDPASAMSFALLQDFEGDHFTFFKPPPEDLEALYGMRVTELAIYDSVEAQVLEQTKLGRIALVEADSYYLPDTRGVSYQLEHTKSTIAINGLDPVGKTLEYFHNTGFYSLKGEDYDGALGQLPVQIERGFLFPYVEFVKFGATAHGMNLKPVALKILRRHLAMRPVKNPFIAFGERFAAQAEMVASRPSEFFHRYAFNTLRQAGANFELLASFISWLEGQGEPGLDEAKAAATEISAQAKIIQFQLARAVMRKNFNGLEEKLEKMSLGYEKLIQVLVQRYG